MVKHMIIWKMKDELADKAAKAAQIKAALEGLVGKIEGLLEMRILTEGLPSSAGDLMMDSLFESQAALDAYQENPLHKEVAVGLVRPAVSARLSFDYTV
ncbi:MAG: Dabb family protein [Clostridia bacterium]|nr:Dabb family protein [Clostridia bacterium]